MLSIVKNQNEEKDKQQILSIFGVPYIRLLVKNVDLAYIEKLKQTYFYIFIFSYTPDDPPVESLFFPYRDNVLQA